MKNTKILFMCFFSIVLSGIMKGQEKETKDYEDIRRHYEDLDKNNKDAFVYINQIIKKAKKEKNYEYLCRAYKDAIYYAKGPEKKLLYADSAIAPSLLSKDNFTISEAYLGKGIVYYFHLKKYQKALDEYIKAYQYSKKTDDEYLKQKMIYHIGVVKSYLGYYKEAQDHFNSCLFFFISKTKGNYHPAYIFNYSKGYLNSLHQLIVCDIHLQEYQKADSLINVGLQFTQNDKNQEFTLEKNYFIKSKGLLEYHKKNYKNSLKHLNEALPIIRENEDLGIFTISNFYIGKNYLQLKKPEKAVIYFKKVDSVFQKNQFILPELRENYEQLINYYKSKNDSKKELYYTKILLKADKIINQDFTYLSSKIHKEYDTDSLLEAKSNLESQKKWGFFIITLLFMVAVFLFLLFWKYYRNEKNIKEKYKLLEVKLTSQKENSNPIQNLSTSLSKISFSEDIYNDIIDKLKIFEEGKQYTEKGLTLTKLAKKLDTNSSYLSLAINETKNLSFNKYLGELRINYITALLYYDKKYLKYTIEALADECGIASRQNFSDLFQEINGIRPKDFIKQRKLEVDNPKD